MANDKREQARIAFIERFEKYHHREANRVVTDAFESGYTAAEGIPQADGWVAIETVDDLPKEDGLYKSPFKTARLRTATLSMCERRISALAKVFGQRLIVDTDSMLSLTENYHSPINASRARENKMTIKIQVLDVTETVEQNGFNCSKCGHRHAGVDLAYICVGCPGDYVPDFDQMAKDEFESEDTN